MSAGIEAEATESPADEGGDEPAGIDQEFTSTIAATLGELHSGELKTGGRQAPDSIELDVGDLDDDTVKADVVDTASEGDRAQAGVIDMSGHDFGGADIERELDTLILELEAGSEVGGGREEEITEVSAARLVIDTGRSLLESDSMDEAEEAFNRALEGETRGAALLGLAEIAQRRGDETKAAKLLAKAEPVIEDVDRSVYDRIVRQQSGS